MATADVVGDRIEVAIHPREVHKIREVPGARYRRAKDGVPDRWLLPLAWGACCALRGVFNDDLQITATLDNWARQQIEDRIQPAMLIRNGTANIVSNDSRLRDYQQLGVSFLLNTRRAILADVMRLGKTVQTAVALQMYNAFPALIVSPSSMRLVWKDELAIWWPEARVAVARGTPTQRRKAIELVQDGEADVLIIGWEALRLHTRLKGYGSAVRLARCQEHGGMVELSAARCEVHPKELNAIEWAAVVADEAHRAKSPRAKQTRALWAVSDGVPIRYALTGTPVLNSPEDIWTLGHFISPEEYPSKTAFLDRYCYTGYNPFGGLEVLGLREDTKAELFKFLDPRFLRRTQEMVFDELPPRIYQRRVVEMTPRQRKAYTEIENEMITALDSGTLVLTNPLVQLGRLRQLASSFADLEDGKIILKEPSCKVDAFLDLLQELGDQPVVAFAESAQLVRLVGAAVEAAGVEVRYVIGGQSDDERAAAIRDFQRGDAQVLLATIGAGGEGITLDRADVCVFLQRSWSVAKNAQAEERIFSVDRQMEVIDLVAENSVEERVEQALVEKGGIIEEVVRDQESLRKLLGGEK